MSVMSELILNVAEQVELKRLLKDYIKESGITIEDTGAEFYDGVVRENLLCAHNLLHKIDPTKHQRMTAEELDKKYGV